jgi:hyperosmotically inducible periplasmic protein
MTQFYFSLASLVIALALTPVMAGQNKTSETGKPDKTVTQDIQNARKEAQLWTTYAMNDSLSAFDIDVEVNGSQAVLSGTVESDIEKDLAEQIALGVEGIGKVDNRLKVDANYAPQKTAAGSERDFGTTVQDATTTAKVKSKLLWNDRTDGLDIDVDTHNGKVTLTGTADTQASKDFAARVARNTDGVRSVDNKLKVGGGTAVSASVSAGSTSASATAGSTGSASMAASSSAANRPDPWITAKVKSTLVFSRNVDGLDIDVDTRNGVVKLSGEVDSAAEKDLAVSLAREIVGVKKVDGAGLKVVASEAAALEAAP